MKQKWDFDSGHVEEFTMGEQVAGHGLTTYVKRGR